MTEWRVGAAPTIRLGCARIVEADGRSVVVFAIGDAVHAYLNECPHRGGPIGEGPVTDGVVMCPWHGWKFDITTGARLGSPGHQLQRVATRFDGDDIIVDLASSPTACPSNA